MTIQRIAERLALRKSLVRKSCSVESSVSFSVIMAATFPSQCYDCRQRCQDHYRASVGQWSSGKRTDTKNIDNIQHYYYLMCAQDNALLVPHLIDSLCQHRLQPGYAEGVQSYITLRETADLQEYFSMSAVLLRDYVILDFSLFLSSPQLSMQLWWGWLLSTWMPLKIKRNSRSRFL